MIVSYDYSKRLLGASTFSLHSLQRPIAGI
jgi:hypothetical protein